MKEQLKSLYKTPNVLNQLLSFISCRDHPLLNFPNMLITPHIGTNTYSTSRRMVQMMVDNALAVIRGEPLLNEVKPK